MALIFTIFAPLFPFGVVGVATWIYIQDLRRRVTSELKVLHGHLHNPTLSSDPVSDYYCFRKMERAQLFCGATLKDAGFSDAGEIRNLALVAISKVQWKVRVQKRWLQHKIFLLERNKPVSRDDMTQIEEFRATIEECDSRLLYLFLGYDYVFRDDRSKQYLRSWEAIRLNDGLAT